jgi:hypothetical protein
MFMGVGIIGALANILSSLLVGSPPAPAEVTAPAADTTAGLEQEIMGIREELAALRQLMEKRPHKAARNKQRVRRRS